MDDASVYLVNVDPTAPGHGQKTPLLYRFESKPGSVIGGNWLSALPYPGFPLDEGTTYALVVTTRVTIGGAAALPSDDFAAIAASDAPADAALAAAQATYQPLWDYLDEPGGDERADVVNAAVFTTQHATDIMALLRRKVRSLPAPAATGIVRYRAESRFLHVRRHISEPELPGRRPALYRDRWRDPARRRRLAGRAAHGNPARLVRHPPHHHAAGGRLAGGDYRHRNREHLPLLLRRQTR